MARQRYVYPTAEIAHLWAHKTQDEARNPQSNFYFEGDTIYSYGGHFPIARHVTHKGKAAILFTTRSYSNTTGHHVNMVDRSIPGNVPTFRVYDPTKDIKGQLDYHKQRFADAKEELIKAGNKTQRALRFRALTNVRSDYNTFAEFFGYAVKTSFELPQSYPHTVAELEANLQEYDAKAKSRSEAAQRGADTRRANQRAAWARRSEEYAKQREQAAQERLARKQALEARLPELLQAWRNGENPPELQYDLHDYPAMLRIVGDEVQTSLGARFPVSHARLALRIVRKCKDTGTVYQRNGHTVHLGHYPLDSIDAQGNVTAGCHHVMWEEIERIAPKLEEVGNNEAQVQS